MKNIVILLCFCLMLGNASGQITISNTTFPVAGDTLKYAVTNNVIGLNMGGNNGPQTWDFSSLKTGFNQNEIYTEASVGPDAASFPDANLLVGTNGRLQYLKSSSNKIEAVGLGGANDFLDTAIVIKYSKRPTIRTAPLEFIKSTSSSGEFKVDISSTLLPAEIKSLIPLNFDSIRIQFSNNSKGIIDAYGTLKMQNKEYPVLREKVESNSETKVFLKLFGLWIDPLPLLGGNIPPGFDGLLGQDTTFIYNFYTDAKKEILVSAQFDSNNSLQQVTFADLGGVISSTHDTYTSEFKVFPNPTSDILRIQSFDLKEGGYLLTISDLSGRLVYAEPIILSPTYSKDINISDFDKGTYILTLRDQFNTFTMSSKFIVK